MAAVHQTMATMHQSLAPPATHALSIYTSGISPSPSRSSSRVRKPVTQPTHRHIWVVAGTSCCGKTTVAEKLAKELGAGKYIEGDEFHPEANKLKMSSGQPLNDDDRAPWLRKLRSLALHRLEGSHGTANVVLTCSALKGKYRDVFRQAEKMNSNVKVHFLFLIAPEGVLITRAASRPGHFFKGDAMIKSQFAVLEMPDDDAETDAHIIDCTKSEKDVLSNVNNTVLRALADDSI